jgi:hypothetical protein
MHLDEMITNGHQGIPVVHCAIGPCGPFFYANTAMCHGMIKSCIIPLGSHKWCSTTQTNEMFRSACSLARHDVYVHNAVVVVLMCSVRIYLQLCGSATCLHCLILITNQQHMPGATSYH